MVRRDWRGVALAAPLGLLLLTLGAQCVTTQHLPPLKYPYHRPTVLEEDRSTALTIAAAGDLVFGTSPGTTESVENITSMSSMEETQETSAIPVHLQLEKARKLRLQLCCVVDDDEGDLDRLYYNHSDGRGRPGDQTRGGLRLPTVLELETLGAVDRRDGGGKEEEEEDRDEEEEEEEGEGTPSQLPGNTTSFFFYSPNDDTTSFGRSRFAWRAQQKWGSHPLPPLEAFTTHGGAYWVAYFHDQAIAAVQQAEDGTVLNCTVQEVIQAWEQREARQYLGQAMPLLPVPLPRMVHLIALCGTISRPPPPTSDAPNPPDPFPLWWLGPSALQGILPGTLWCGRQDTAASYHQLGHRAELDACCRDHDHCPVKLQPLKTRYGVTNFGFATRSHCICELEFLRCLKALEDQVSKMVGNIYFNLLRMECLASAPSRQSHNLSAEVLQPPPPPPLRQLYTVPEEDSLGEPRGLEDELGGDDTTPTTSGGRLDCARRERDGSCRMWLQNPKGFTQRYVKRPTKLVF